MPSILIGQDTIMRILKNYVKINSESGTALENKASTFVVDFFRDKPYFKSHQDHFGLHPVEGDPLKREIAWALVKGRGQKTVVLIHHFDVVGIEDFNRFKDLAFEPELLMEALLKAPDQLSQDAYSDLSSGNWLFGRGTADMKAGGAIQMAIIEAYSRLESFEGNLLLIAVPDEENLSAGMRNAATLLTQLREKHTLTYNLMINSEPHQRKESAKGLLSGGSIGKILPFVYARGRLAHVGKSAEGFNPLLLLSEMMVRTEMNPLLADYNPEVKEMSPLPTWLMARDSKVTYDVSMPLSAFGCISVHPLMSKPDDVMNQLMKIAVEVARDVGKRVNDASGLFFQKTGRQLEHKQWKPQALLYSQWVLSLKAQYGEAFEAYADEKFAPIKSKVLRGELTHLEATRQYVDALFDFAGCDEPTLILGIVPPFYSSVCYLDAPEYTEIIQRVHKAISHEATQKHDQTYDLEAYFTGISDLSYSSIDPYSVSAIEATISGEMPLYGQLYNIPFEEIKNNAMACINVGPWGKDFHKISERVLIEDILERTPQLILCTLETVFNA